MTIEQHADALRLVAGEIDKVRDTEVGTPADQAFLRAASDLARAAALNLDEAAAHDADPAMLLSAQRLARASATASRSISPENEDARLGVLGAMADRTR